MAAVLKGKVDAIVFTGGIAYSEYVMNSIREYVEFIAPIVLKPGEYEMDSLGKNSYLALIGEVEMKELRED